MSTTITYKGWITLSSPKRNRDGTVILAPNRFFYRPKKHVIIEKIRADSEKYGKFVNIRIWMYHHKIDPAKDFLTHAIMGYMNIEYSEISRSESGYSHTLQYINFNDFDLLEELISYYHHYCIIEVTYSQSEFDMISHEMELILLRNSHI